MLDMLNDELMSEIFIGCQEIQTPELVSCPMCNGTGIFVYNPYDIYSAWDTCALCNGTKLCSPSDADLYNETMRNVSEYMHGSTTNMPISQSHKSSDDLRLELENAEMLLENMKHFAADCSSYTIAAQYSSMIYDQQQYIISLRKEIDRIEKAKHDEEMRNLENP